MCFFFWIVYIENCYGKVINVYEDLLNFEALMYLINFYKKIGNRFFPCNFFVDKFQFIFLERKSLSSILF